MYFNYLYVSQKKFLKQKKILDHFVRHLVYLQQQTYTFSSHLRIYALYFKQYFDFVILERGNENGGYNKACRYFHWVSKRLRHFQISSVSKP